MVCTKHENTCTFRLKRMIVLCTIKFIIKLFSLYYLYIHLNTYDLPIILQHTEMNKVKVNKDLFNIIYDDCACKRTPHPYVLSPFYTARTT